MFVWSDRTAVVSKKKAVEYLQKRRATWRNTSPSDSLRSESSQNLLSQTPNEETIKTDAQLEAKDITSKFGDKRKMHLYLAFQKKISAAFAERREYLKEGLGLTELEITNIIQHRRQYNVALFQAKDDPIRFKQIVQERERVLESILGRVNFEKYKEFLSEQTIKFQPLLAQEFVQKTIKSNTMVSLALQEAFGLLP